MGSDAMIYIIILITIGLGSEVVGGGIHRQQCNIISLLLFFFSK
jgi:hypothetical protein